jgi:hypothetical protein
MPSPPLLVESDSDGNGAKALVNFAGEPNRP